MMSAPSTRQEKNKLKTYSERLSHLTSHFHTKNGAVSNFAFETAPFLLLSVNKESTLLPFGRPNDVTGAFFNTFATINTFTVIDLR